MARHTSQQRPGFAGSTFQHSRSCTEPAGSGTNPMNGEPWASPGPRAESSSCVGDEAMATDTSSKKHQVHFYFSLHCAQQLLQRCKALVVKYSSPWLFQEKQGRIKSAMGKEERLWGHAASVPGSWEQRL